MSAGDMLTVLAQPYAAFQLGPNGATHVFDDVAALCGWMLDRKGHSRLSVRNTHLVWGDQPQEQRATVTMELVARDAAAGSGRAESWRLITLAEDASAILQAVKACRAARKVAA